MWVMKGTDHMHTNRRMNYNCDMLGSYSSGCKNYCTVFWNAMPYSFTDKNKHVRKTCCFHLQDAYPSRFI